MRLGMSEFKGARITLINTVKSVGLLCRCTIRPKPSSSHVLDCVGTRELTVLQPNLAWMQQDYFSEQVWAFDVSQTKHWKKKSNS